MERFMATGSEQERQHQQVEGDNQAILPDGRLTMPKDITTRINKQAAPAASKPATGSLIARQSKPVFLDIGNLVVELPNQPMIVLGRKAQDSTSIQPDLPLDQYGAVEKGVSRCHARITRYYNLLYVTDMGSRNGTFLNGQPLTNNNARILHTGDELLLGTLKLRIRF
jgi:pSer/pThr/pTyr-binding forkhead associated (FHA) protein